MPSVTGKVYNHSKRMKEKRAVLDGVAAELRRIIGQSVPTTQAETELKDRLIVNSPVAGTEECVFLNI